MPDDFSFPSRSGPTGPRPAAAPSQPADPQLVADPGRPQNPIPERGMSARPPAPAAPALDTSDLDAVPTRGQIAAAAAKRKNGGGEGGGPETEEDRIARRNKAAGIRSARGVGRLVTKGAILANPGAAGAAVVEATVGRASQKVVGAFNKLPGMGLVSKMNRTAKYGVGSPSAEGMATMPASLARQVAERVLLTNPIGIAVKALVNLLPIRNPYVRFGAAACGTCGGQCACDCACSTVGQFFALLFLVIIVATFVLGGSAPTFAPPAFCSMEGATTCANSTSVSVTVDPKEIPPDAVTAYREIETETGLPWFYFVGMEKISTNFGKATNLPHEDPDGTAYMTAIADAQRAADAASTSDEGSKVDNGGVGAQIVADQKDLIARTSTKLRGGSFGLILVTSAEYAKYGKNSAGDNYDPWVRQNVAAIVAAHLQDRFAALATNGATLTTETTPVVQQLDPALSAYIENQINTALNNKDGDTLFRYMSYIGVGPDGKVTSCSLPSPGPASSGSASAGTPNPSSLSSLPALACVFDTQAKWPSGPAFGSVIGAPDRYYMCSVLTSAGLVKDNTACSRFVDNKITLKLDKDHTSLKDWIAQYYTAGAGPGSAGTISDWPRLNALLGALMADGEFWGAEPTAIITQPGLDPNGALSGSNITYNVYAQAIVTYGEQAHDGFANAARAQSTSPENWGALSDIEARDFVFWGPIVSQGAADSSVRKAYLNGTLDEMGLFACQDAPSAFTTEQISQRIAESQTGGRPWKAEDPANPSAGGDYLALADGTLVSVDNPSQIQGCWRFGQGQGVRWGADETAMADLPAANSPIPSIATNRCTAANRGADGTCGIATVSLLDDGGKPVKTANVVVTGFCDCASGYDQNSSPFPDRATERIAALNGAAQSALGVPASGGFNISLALLARPAVTGAAAPSAAPSAAASPAPGSSPAPSSGPGAAGTPAYATAFDFIVAAGFDPGAAVKKLGQDMSAGVTKAAGADLNTLDFVKYWKTHPIPTGSCADASNGAQITVLDAYSQAALGSVVACPYLADVLPKVYAYGAAELSNSGAMQYVVTSTYGRQAVSPEGFIWPIEGITMMDGFDKRTSYASSIGIQFANGSTQNMHDGLDLVKVTGARDPAGGFPCGHTPLLAVADGTVEYILEGGATGIAYDLRLFPDAYTGIYIGYGHTNAIVPPEDQPVAWGKLGSMGGTKRHVHQGDVIGYLGTTGASDYNSDTHTGSSNCHLHLAVVLTNYSAYPFGKLSESSYDWPWVWMGQQVNYKQSMLGLGWAAPRIDPMHIMPHDATTFSGGDKPDAKPLHCDVGGVCYYQGWSDNGGWPHYIDAQAFKQHKLVLDGVDSTVIGAGDPTGDPVLDGVFAATGTHFGWKYVGLMETYAKNNGLDPYLVAAVVRGESNFSPTAGSSAGAVGLMQIMPSAWQGCYGDSQPLSARTDPTLNVACGTGKLAATIRGIPGPDSSRMDRALWCYNWGNGGCHHGDPAYYTALTDFPPSYVSYIHKFYDPYIAYARSLGAAQPAGGLAAPQSAASAPVTFGGETPAGLPTMLAVIDDSYAKARARRRR